MCSMMLFQHNPDLGFYRIVTLMILKCHQPFFGRISQGSDQMIILSHKDLS
jgi:hypothetical protein